MSSELPSQQGKSNQVEPKAKEHAQTDTQAAFRAGPGADTMRAFSQKGHRALDAEIKAFCVASGLTPRESDILAILVEGVVKIKDVAVRLKLSPNTINNHVNSIFTKTRTTSKSQLLAEFLNYVTEELERTRFFRQTPHVVVMARDSVDLQVLRKELEPRGFRMTCVSNSAQLFEFLVSLRPRFSVVDLAMVEGPTSEFLLKLEPISRGTSEVLFIGSKEDVRDRAHAMALGAMDLLIPSEDAGQIYVTMMCRYIEGDSDRVRFLSAAAVNIQKSHEVLTVRGNQLGAGGLAVPTTDLERVLKNKFRLGDFVELKLRFHIDESIQESALNAFIAHGQVVWSMDCGRPGVRQERTAADEVSAKVSETAVGSSQTGVRFVHLPGPSRELLQGFTREHHIKAFIPCPAFLDA